LNRALSPIGRHANPGTAHFQYSRQFHPIMAHLADSEITYQAASISKTFTSIPLFQFCGFDSMSTKEMFRFSVPRTLTC
jgi:hypothetical protein